jgi:hypothetical protein
MNETLRRLTTLLCAVSAFASCPAHAEITRHGGGNDAVPDQKYIHVVSETDSPVTQTWIKATACTSRQRYASPRETGLFRRW